MTAAAVCGLSLAPTACAAPSGPGTGAPAPPATAEPDTGSSTEAAGGDPILTGQRQVSIATADGGGAPLVVNSHGRLVADRTGNGPDTLFVLWPSQGRHQLQVMEADGDRSCMGLSDKAASDTSYAEATVVAAPCAPSRDGQLWTLKKTEHGYFISSGDLYLGNSTESGLAAREQGEGLPSPGLFTFVDEGAAD